jgi:YceI-like protein
MAMLSRALVVVGVAVCLGGCTPPVREAAPLPTLSAVVVPAGFPAKDYEQAAAQGKRVFRIDARQSLITITVRRGGSLARFGHDHIIASRGVQGYVAPDDGRADLFVPLDDLTVDEPALRTEAALDTQPTASDIDGTRTNMLDLVLETQRFPFALIAVSGVDKTLARAQVPVSITLHGVQRNLVVPVQMEASSDALRVSGELEFNQSDFGIVPFSILGGAVQVQDRLGLRFVLRAGKPQD